MFSIDHDVPMPPAVRRLYPLAELAIGDSFLVPATPTRPTCVIKDRLKSAYRKQRCKHPGWRAAIRSVPGGVRLWRTA